MAELSWTPLFRTAAATVTKVLRSPAFLESRSRAGHIVDDPAALLRLAERVESIDHVNAPVSAVSDRLAAAVSFVRAMADRLDAAASPGGAGSPAQSDAEAPVAARAARERLIVAALHYLITPDDLVPDFRPGGYIDDVLLLSWVFGAAVSELEPYLDENPVG